MIANDVAKLTEPGRGAVLLHAEPGRGVIDDLIVYLPVRHRLAHRRQCRHRRQGRGLDAGPPPGGFDATLVRRDLAMIAVQGPNARARDLGRPARQRSRVR